MKQFYPKKTYLLSLIFIALISFSSFSQVGIGTIDPKTQLDVEGALSLKEGTPIALVNGANGDLDLGTTPYSFYRISGPSADFSITGIVPVTDADGQIVTLVNATTQTLTIAHNTGTSTSRIFTGGEADVVLTGRYSTATFQYNTQQNKWYLTSTSAGSNDWKITGNDNIDGTTNFIGTTNDQDVVMKRNGFDRLKLGTTGTILNEDSQDFNFRVETDDNASTLFVDGGTNRVGIKTNNPQTDFHVAGASSIVRVESLNSTNDANNNGLVPSIVKVDTNGNLVLTDSDPIDAVTLATDYSLTATGAFSDVPAMSLTFVARKSTVMVTLTGSGDSVSLAAGIGDFLVYNVTSAAIFGGTHEKLTTFDDVLGLLSATWSTSFSKPLTGLTVGNTYTLKVQSFFDPLLVFAGTPALRINGATETFHHHLTLSVAQ